MMSDFGKPGLRFRAAILDYWNKVSILAVHEDAAGHIVSVGKPMIIEMVEYSDRNVIGDGTLDLTEGSAQSLLDALINAGMRPTKQSSPTGEIARLTDHLQDMRRLVFKDKK